MDRTALSAKQERVLKLKAQGLTFTAIARQMRISDSYASLLHKAAIRGEVMGQIDVNSRPVGMSPEKVVELRRQGMSFRQIGKMFGCSGQAAQSAEKRARVHVETEHAAMRREAAIRLSRRAEHVDRSELTDYTSPVAGHKEQMAALNAKRAERALNTLIKSLTPDTVCPKVWNRVLKLQKQAA